MTTIRRLRTPSRDELCALLAAPARPAEPLAARLHDALIERLSDTPAPAGPARRRVDAFSVERGGATFSTPFAWSARASRRALGTAAARAVATGASPDPLRAASDEVDRLCDRSARGLARPGSLAAWLAGEPPVVRGLCALEGATWAAALLALVAPSRALAVGVADAWFEVPGAGLALQGRRDAVAATHGSPRRALLRVRDGAPGDRAIAGLEVDGLVEALAAPDRPLPARVVGAWPDAGVVLALEFDDASARAGARSLVEAARSGTEVAAGAPKVAIHEPAAA